MYQLKFVRFFSFDEPVTEAHYMTLTEQVIPAIPEGARTAFGWCATEKVSRLQTPNHRQYIIGQFECVQRSVPKALADRHVEKRRKEMLESNMIASKEDLQNFAAEAYELLAEKLDPEYLDCNVIYLPERNLLMMTAKKRAILDDLAVGLHHQFKNQESPIRPLQLEITEKKLNTLAKHYQRAGITVNEVVFKNGGIIRAQPHNSEPNYYNDLLSSGTVDRVTFRRNDLLNVTLTSKGLIHDAIPSDQFESEWRATGSGEESHYLDCVRAGIWIDELLDVIDHVVLTADQLAESAEQPAVMTRENRKLSVVR